MHTTSSEHGTESAAQVLGHIVLTVLRMSISECGNGLVATRQSYLHEIRQQRRLTWVHDAGVSATEYTT